MRLPCGQNIGELTAEENLKQLGNRLLFFLGKAQTYALLDGRCSGAGC